MVMVAEGVKSAPTVMALAERCGVEMPIARDVCQVIEGNRTPMQAFQGLIRHMAGAESEPG
jgi:glycerol-3-phosphate dehydrogenase (NAD(P)+)